MNSMKNLSKVVLVSLVSTISLLTGCDSDNNSAELARAVELESQRALGTIIETVTIVNDQIRLIAGETHQLSATGIDSNGDTRDVTDELIWTSSDSNIAKVSSSGLVTAVENSDVDQGRVIITGTTINDIFSEGEISVSDVAVSAITLKQTSPETGDINTCINASVSGDVSYLDGYIALNTVKDMSFTLDKDSTATISDEGILYTSAEGIESTTITATIDNVSTQLNVTANSENLDNIRVFLEDEDEEISTITLNIGDRVQFFAQAELIESVSEDTYDIGSSVNWLQYDTDILGITETTDENEDFESDYDYNFKGTVLALTKGITELSASCGGIENNIIVIVEGDAELESIQITDADEEIVDNSIIISPLDTIKITLTALYGSTPTSLNITEFSSWEISGDDIVTLELINFGTSEAYYELTSTSSSEGSVVILATYKDIITSLSIEIEE